MVSLLQVDGTVAAEIVSAWTGVPLGRMAEDEIRTIRSLGAQLEEIPYQTTILNFRRLLEKPQLATAVFKQINAHLACKGMSLRAGVMTH